MSEINNNLGRSNDHNQQQKLYYYKAYLNIHLSVHDIEINGYMCFFLLCDMMLSKHSGYHPLLLNNILPTVPAKWLLARF